MQQSIASSHSTAPSPRSFRARTSVPTYLDLSATYPPEADARWRLVQRSLTAESIARFAPTVLLATEIAGPEGALDDLRRLGYPLVIVPNEASRIRCQDSCCRCGAWCSRARRGAVELETTIASNRVESADDPPIVISLYGHQPVLERPLATHWLIEAAGGIDAADLLGIGEGSPVNAEAILAIGPDIVLVPDAGLEGRWHRADGCRRPGTDPSGPESRRH